SVPPPKKLLDAPIQRAHNTSKTPARAHVSPTHLRALFSKRRAVINPCGVIARSPRNVHQIQSNAATRPAHLPTASADGVTRRDSSFVPTEPDQRVRSPSTSSAPYPVAPTS